MSKATAYTVASQKFTDRLLLKVHKQNVVHAIETSNRRRLSELGKITLKNVDELIELRHQHERTLDVSCKTRALQILKTLPLISTDEDPHFIQTLRALRAAAYFDASSSLSTFSLLNHLTKHAYLLDAQNFGVLFPILRQLQHPQTREVIQIVLPRLREVSGDLTVSEGRAVLAALHHFNMLDDVVLETVTTTTLNLAEHVPLQVLSKTLLLLSTIDVAYGRRLLESPGVGSRLAALLNTACRVFEEGGEEEEKEDAVVPIAEALRSFFPSHFSSIASITLSSQPSIAEMQGVIKTIFLDICKTVAHLCWGPRKLMNSIARYALHLSTNFMISDRNPHPSANHLDKSKSTATTENNSNNNDNNKNNNSTKLLALTEWELPFVLNAFKMSSYRHERVVRHLVASTATQIGLTFNTHASGVLRDGSQKQCLLASTVAIETLAHFYFMDAVEGHLDGLLQPILPYLDGFYFSCWLQSAARLRLHELYPHVLEMLCGAPLTRWVNQSNGSISLSAVIQARVLCALITLRPAALDTIDAEETWCALFGSISRRLSHYPQEGKEAQPYLYQAIVTIQDGKGPTNSDKLQEAMNQALRDSQSAVGK